MERKEPDQQHLENSSVRRTGSQVIYPELSYLIVQIAYEIANNLGPGFPEKIYENAFIKELRERQIQYEEQVEVRVDYKGELMGVFRLDLVIDKKIVLELKAVTELNDLFKQQTRSYLRASGLKLGLLINFGAKSVQFVRVLG